MNSMPKYMRLFEARHLEKVWSLHIYIPAYVMQKLLFRILTT